jgi:hypothetical protein
MLNVMVIKRRNNDWKTSGVEEIVLKGEVQRTVAAEGGAGGMKEKKNKI